MNKRFRLTYLRLSHHLTPLKSCFKWDLKVLLSVSSSRVQHSEECIGEASAVGVRGWFAV